MFGWECWCWNGVVDPLDFCLSDPQPFSLPSPLPKWPPGKGFSTGRISLGEIEVYKISKLKKVWRCSQGAVFYKPQAIPDGFFCLGHYCQPSDNPLKGYVLVARGVSEVDHVDNSVRESPALKRPVNYTLIWSSGLNGVDSGFIWLPNAPEGYRAMGFLVTDRSEEPSPDDIRCVRADLTERCETGDLIVTIKSKSQSFHVWETRPFERGMYKSGVSVGTFFCCTSLKEYLNISCLKNLSSTFEGMPNLNQVQALIGHYGPTVFFHPDEAYFPSSVPWFFKNGALLYRNGNTKGEPIDMKGSNLPCGGENDGEYWIDLPTNDNARETLKSGNIETARLYVHVKPALGGTFTDIVMWVFCPFNGPAAIKVSFLNIKLKKIGEHVSDWEHFTLRICNFSGELWRVYFSEHSGGKWVDASDLEFIQGNKPIVYSSKHGHASYPHPGSYLQGSVAGIGVRNDAARSKFFIDSSSKYEIIAAEYLGDGYIAEPDWLQYMREWGPTVMYNSRSEIERLIDLLPPFVQFSLEDLLALFPTELYGEEGPTGPKEKNNWFGDERC
ncbi:hypothetical protein IC582_003701 [Cucumis melo]|uniref:Vacuolar protein sorting-associated protein 62 n=2 Tax=Cucumis melo TaxID=3656 RepID=A0A9I9CY26_CUCME|nr:hypothetical protein At1g04090 [Cucumis melo]KAA0038434.1 vacuolar protein sorting-associated protein 62-like [Cucumis melo var. makuwa]